MAMKHQMIIWKMVSLVNVEVVEVVKHFHSDALSPMSIADQLISSIAVKQRTECCENLKHIL